MSDPEKKVTYSAAFQKLRDLPELALTPVETDALGRVYLRKQSAEDRWRLQLAQKQLADAGMTTIPPFLVVAISICDEAGDYYLAEGNIEEGMALIRRKLSAKDTTKIYEKFIEVAGLGDRALEEAEKKSLSSQSSNSGTSSSTTASAAGRSKKRKKR